MSIDLKKRPIKYGIKKKKLVIGKVEATYKDLDDISIVSDSIAFVLEFEPA